MLDYQNLTIVQPKAKAPAHNSTDCDSSKSQWTAHVVVPFSLGSQGEETVGTVFLL